MTIHDDLDLELLERDLRQLAEPREDDEQIRLAIRAQLDGRLRPRPPRRRRVSRRMAFRASAVSAAAAAVAAAVLVLVVGTNGSGGPTAADAAIIHHALTAVTPPAGDILHAEMTGVHSGVTFVNEVWRQTAPPYVGRAIKDHEEFSISGTTESDYDPATNTIYEHPNPASQRPFADPVAKIRQELASGQAHVNGTVVIDGASLYEVDMPDRTVGYFDTGTYALRYVDVPQVGRLRVVIYEYLPMTSANQKLLSVIAQHPSARIDTNPSDAPQPGGY
ncbi:MAG: hypothetical protein WAU75_00455 [Solirubrobacteraceae bacterium]